MKAIIVDDEPKAIQLLSDYCGHVNSIEVLETFRNALKAFEYLTKNQVELIFLDINMPEVSGMSLAKMIDPKVKVIFTTAYSEYAAESYDVGAVDYLLKPISLERFLKAVSKVITAQDNNTTTDVLAIKSGGKTYRLSGDAILFLEKDGNYMVYHTAEHKILTRQTVQDSLIALPDHFVQVHKSFILNLHKVSSFTKESAQINGFDVPLGEMYKNEFFSKMG